MPRDINADQSLNRAELASKLIKAINNALNRFASECSQSVMETRDRDLSKFECGKGYETPESAWDRILSDVGVPYSDGKKFARMLDLDNDAASGFVAVDARSINHLLQALEEIAK